MRIKVAFHAALLLVLLGLAPRAGAQPKDDAPPPDPATKEMLQARRLETAIWAYTSAHDGHLPADLHELFEAMRTKAGVTNDREAAQKFLVSPSHAGLLLVPEKLTPEWENAGSSYRYLGNGQVKLSEIQDVSSIVITHMRLDRGLPVEKTPENPEGELFPLAFLDGHVEMATLNQAQRLISQSVATLDAFRDGTDLPPQQLAAQCAGLIVKAIRAYAAAHDGILPPDLGATLPYVPDTRATSTLTAKARVFLTPHKDSKDLSIPANPSSEWINANCWWIYLGSADLSLASMDQPRGLVLVVGHRGEPFDEHAIDGGRRELVPVGPVGETPFLASREYADWITSETRKTADALRSGGALPDWVQALRDVWLLGQAIEAYAKDHGGAPPPDLGATLEYLPPSVQALLGRREAPEVARARVFLSPGAEWTTPIPDHPTPAWINSSGTYEYLGGIADNREKLIRANAILVRGPLHEELNVKSSSLGTFSGIPCVMAFGETLILPRELVERNLEEARSRIKELERDAAPSP